jgi:ABC-2 type transport system permease protein
VSAPEIRPAGFRAVTLAVAWRSIHNFLTNAAFLVPALVFPLFFFVSFAGGLSAISEVPGFDFPTGYTAFQFVFVLLQSAAFGGVFTGFGIARDFETGFGRRYMLTTVALVAGMEIGGSPGEIVALYALAVLVNVAATMWSAGVAMRVRSIQGGPLMQFPTFLILFLAPVYVPLDLLSGWIHTVASINPITALLEAGRGFISGDPTVIALAFAIAIALPLLFSLWARGGLRRAEAAG